MDLEKLRVKNGFDYEFLINENIDIESLHIAPLLLQPIIENAIWHGLANAELKGKIIISTEVNNSFLILSIENNSDGYKVAKIITNDTVVKRKSFGLQIVKERLKLISKEKRKKSNLTISPTSMGMIVNLSIPI